MSAASSALLCAWALWDFSGELDESDLSLRDCLGPQSVAPISRPPRPPFHFERRTNSLGLIFVTIPDVEPFFCIWDVRVADFEAFVAATHYDATEGMLSPGPEGWTRQGGSWKNPGYEQGPTHPVAGVSWNDAMAFCDWLTKTEQAQGLLAATQLYRLPTDWEWGAAADFSESLNATPALRQDSRSAVYPWGKDWPPPPGAGNYAGTELLGSTWPAEWEVIANYNDGFLGTSPVGTFGANPFGLYDMGGNVWQWCEDYYNGHYGPRVLRGGSWTDGREGSYSSCREFDLPQIRMNNFGFRLVLANSARKPK
jgi:formylglycine-generating enzyme required for sulfatase activity